MSINTLLGAPRKLICQCCGMPLEDDRIISHDSDGTLNEDYCKWCYADGTYTYSNKDDLIDVCVKIWLMRISRRNRCFGVLAGMDFIMVCTYEEEGENPELVVYKKR